MNRISIYEFKDYIAIGYEGELKSFIPKPKGKIKGEYRLNLFLDKYCSIIGDKSWFIGEHKVYRNFKNNTLKEYLNA